MLKSKVNLWATFALLLCITSVFAQNNLNSKAAKLYMVYLTESESANPNYFRIRDAFDAYWNKLNEKEKAEQERSRKMFARWDVFWSPRMQGSNGNFMEYLAYRDKLLLGLQRKTDTSTIKKNLICPVWYPIGPDTSFYSGTNGIGRVSRVAFHNRYNGQYSFGVNPPAWDRHANTLFAASHTGGLWKSENGGRNWANLNTDFLPHIGVGDFIQSPYHESDMYIVSSHEQTVMGGFDGQEGGHGSAVMYRSTNGGASWQGCGAPFSPNWFAYSSNQRIISDVEIIPTGNYQEQMLVACDQGVYSSTDKGVTWTQRFSPANYGNSYTSGPSGITPDVLDSKRVYLSGSINWATGSTGNNANRIYYSDNYGNNWTLWQTIDKHNCVAGTLSLGIPVNSNMYISSHKVFVSPVDKNKIYVFIEAFGAASSVNLCGTSVVPYNGSIIYTFQSSDRGNTWVRKSITGNTIPKIAGCIIDPLNDNHILVYQSVGTSGGNMRHSVDGGATWVNVATPPFMHADMRHAGIKQVSACATPSTHLIAGGDGGVDICTDLSQVAVPSNWHSATGKGLQLMQIYNHASSATNSNYMVFGAQDNGSWHRYTTAAGIPAWKQVWAGDGFDCVYDHVDPNLFYVTDNQSTGVLKQFTVTGAGTYSYSGNLKPSGTSQYWISPLEMNPQRHETIFAGYQALYKRNGTTGTWQSYSLNSLYSGYSTKNITTIGIAPTDSNLILVSREWGWDNDGKRLARTTNGGGTWSVSGSWWTNFISGIAFSATNKNNVYVCCSGYQAWANPPGKLFNSQNGGVSWTRWDTGLPDVPINCIAIDEVCGYLYIGTDYGVYRRRPADTQWVQFGCGLPNVIVSDISFFGTQFDRKLRVSTYGRGMWEVSIACLP